MTTASHELHKRTFSKHDLPLNRRHSRANERGGTDLSRIVLQCLVVPEVSSCNCLVSSLNYEALSERSKGESDGLCNGTTLCASIVHIISTCSDLFSDTNDLRAQLMSPAPCVQLGGSVASFPLVLHGDEVDVVHSAFLPHLV